MGDLLTGGGEQAPEHLYADESPNEQGLSSRQLHIVLKGNTFERPGK